MIYLPEIKYRRIMNKAFGPGGWGLAPRTETNVGPKIVSREYALVCQGRCVSCDLLNRVLMHYLDWLLSPVANKNTLILVAFRLRLKRAKVMHS